MVKKEKAPLQAESRRYRVLTPKKTCPTVVKKINRKIRRGAYKKA